MTTKQLKELDSHDGFQFESAEEAAWYTLYHHERTQLSFVPRRCIGSNLAAVVMARSILSLETQEQIRNEVKNHVHHENWQRALEVIYD